MRAIVRRHDDDGVFVDIQVLQSLDEVFKRIAQPCDHGGIPFLCYGPFLFGISGVDVGIDFAFRRIDQLVGFPHPLYAAFHAASFRIGSGGYLKLGMGRGVCQRQKKGFAGILAVRIHNPLFGAGRQQIHGISLVAIPRDTLVSIPNSAFLVGEMGLGSSLG